jgi:uncharacterized membrane protein
MSTIEESVTVEVPVHTAYDQWTHFETFSDFMDGVDEVMQITDSRALWRTRIGGVEREFQTEITEQSPDERIAWHALNGVSQAGQVTFLPLAPDRTRVVLQLDFEPENLVEMIGDRLGILDRRIKTDLAQFKEYIEAA